MLLDVPAELELAEPIVVTLHGSTPEDRSGATSSSARRHAKAAVVLEHTGAALRRDHLFVVGDGAQVTVVNIQDWDDDAVHLGRDAIRVGRDASVRHSAISLRRSGAPQHRGRVRRAPAARPSSSACTSPTPGSTSSTGCSSTTTLRRSNVDYKGALQGQGAHAVWIGDVLIRKAAEGIETYESNRNLVLTDGCRADSVPNLEIETGEIEAPATPRPRKVRRPAAVLPAVARHRRGRGAPPRGARVLRHHPQDRRPGPGGAPARHGRGRAGEERGGQPPRW